MRFKLLTTRNAALAVLSALLAMCLAIGVFMLPNVAAADGEEAEPQYVHTYILGASGTDTETLHHYTDMAAGWNEAVVQDGNVLVKLESDWALSAYLLVPSETDVTLDLNGHVIDRGLTSAEANGYIIKIFGTLTVTDSDPGATHETVYTYEEGTADDQKAYLTKTVEKELKGGIITGGYSSDTVGGIWVAGKFNLNGGTIYGNTTNNQFGGGVYVEQYRTFTMNGGAIIKNTVSYNGTDKSKPAMGGGVAVYGAGAKFTFNGGLIADNVSENVASTKNSDANGGGVEIYGTGNNQAEFIMNGGILNNNRTISPYNAFSVGGAIGVQYAVAKISGGEISDNRNLQVKNSVIGYHSSYSHGAAIGANATNNGWIDGAKTEALTVSGGLITRNAAFYGTIYMFGDQYYTGGEIVNNISFDSAGIKLNNSEGTKIHVSGTFKFHDNPVVDTDLNDLKVDGSCEFPYMDNSNSGFGNPEDNSHAINVGKLEEDVLRRIFVSDWVLDRNIGVTSGYTENNSKVYTVNGKEYEIPVNPNKYFESGRPEEETTTLAGLKLEKGQGKIVLNDKGEVAFATDDKEIVFTVNYSDGTSEVFNYDTCDYYGVAITYSEKTITSIEYNGVEIANSAITDVGMYEFTGRIGTDAEKGENNAVYKNITELFTIFRVVVQPKEITAGDEKFTASFGTVTFDGSEQKPEPASVMYNGIELVNGTDYDLSYSNNINAGNQAKAVFTFKGSYAGKVTVNFTINADTTEYNLTWQYHNGTEWVALNNATLIYDGTDQSGKVRAVLSTNPNSEVYVYAQNVSEQNTGNMYLQLSGAFGGERVDRLLNAADYTVTVAGTGNHILPDNKSVTVTVAPQTIEFASLGYEDEKNTRLWQLTFGDSHSNLRDSVTYIVGDNAVVGEETDAYARFRDMLLTISLNPNYVYNGRPLSYYMGIAEVTYEEAGATGTEKTVTEVQTTVTFAFNANFAVSGATDNTVTLNKTWYIVTINNGLLNSDGSNATLPVFTYGEQTNVQPFKPEHGDTVYFTFRQSTEVKARVAVVYSGGEKTFHLFGVNDNGYVLGDVMPDTNYFARVINSFNAGNYQLDVHVDEYTDSDEVIYYAIDRTFNLTVNAYSIVEAEVTDKRIEVSVATPELAYSNSAQAPEVEVTFDGEQLVYGKDFTVTTSSVNVGAAVAQVNGLGNFGGSLEVGFTIIKADNEWVSAPNIIRWVFGGFNSGVNIVTSIPKFMSAQDSVAYTVLDSDKQEINATLTNFHVEGNGVVTDTVAKELAQLNSGTYYLVSKLSETANYYALDTSGNPLEFNVIQATNGWAVLPDVIEWSYKDYNLQTNLILGTPNFGNVIYVVEDESGKELTKEFALTDGVVPNDVKELFENLACGKYYLVAKVESSGNYSLLNEKVEFNVAQAVNSWEVSLGITSWVAGSYGDLEQFPITVEAKFGSVNVKLTGTDGDNVLYEGLNGTEELEAVLAGLGAGRYVLAATVAGVSDFGGLNDFIIFSVFAPEGLAWWIWLLIIVGILGVIALIFFILHEKGVLQMLTGRFVIAMRTKMSVDATIAAVRANKRAEEAKISIAEAEARDRREEFNSASPEEQAAILENKVKEAQVVVDRIQDKMSKVQNKANDLKAKNSDNEDKG